MTIDKTSQTSQKVTWKAILLALFQMIYLLSMILTFTGFFIVYLNSNMEYFQDLPHIVKVAIPFGYIFILLKIIKKISSKRFL